MFTRVRESIKKYEDKVAVYYISFIKGLILTLIYAPTPSYNVIDMLSSNLIAVKVLLSPKFKTTLYVTMKHGDVQTMTSAHVV